MFKRFFPISSLLAKRQKFIITALLLSIGLLAIQLTNITWRYQAIAGLAFLTYWLSAWSLRPGLNGIEWLTTLVLPVFFTAGVGLFYFLLPVAWSTRLPVAIVYGLGMYVLLLTENIFSVAAIRTIQLLRAAHAVGFLLTLAVGFFLYDTVFSFRFDFWLNFLLVGLISCPLVLANLWSVNLEEKLNRKLWLFSLSFALILAEMALAFSFWPVSVVSGSLFLVTVMYILLGLGQLEFSEKLFKRSIYEYIGVGITVLLIMVMTTRWGG
ncbi:hypothetical protein ACFL0Y_01860 [Patescibacteria group bacterium]